MITQPDAYLRPRQVEATYPITANHLAQLRYRGTGPRYLRPTPRVVVYKASDIETWLEQNATEPAPQAAA